MSLWEQMQLLTQHHRGVVSGKKQRIAKIIPLNLPKRKKRIKIITFIAKLIIFSINRIYTSIKSAQF